MKNFQLSNIDGYCSNEFDENRTTRSFKWKFVNNFDEWKLEFAEFRSSIRVWFCILFCHFLCIPCKSWALLSHEYGKCFEMKFQDVCEWKFNWKKDDRQVWISSHVQHSLQSIDIIHMKTEVEWEQKQTNSCHWMKMKIYRFGSWKGIWNSSDLSRSNFTYVNRTHQEHLSNWIDFFCW